MAVESVKKFSIDTSEGEKNIKNLRGEIKELRNALGAVEKGSEAYNAVTQELLSKQKELSNVTRVTAASLNTATDSIVGMEQEYRKLYNEYKLLTEAERNSPFGQKMAADLKALQSNLNQTKMAVGNFKDNIGNYTESIVNAFGQMGFSVSSLLGPFQNIAGALQKLTPAVQGTTKAAGGFKGILDLISAHPIIAVLATLVGLFMTVKEAISGNEELQNRWNEAMAAFEPIINGVKIALDLVAQVVVKIAEGMGKVVTWFSKASKETQKLAKDTNELNKARRETDKLNAKEQAHVDYLKAEAAATDDVLEKTKLLNQAKEEQEKIDQRNIDNAKEELRILKEKAKLTPNSKEDNDALAKAEMAVSQAESAAANNARALNKQLTTLNKTKENAAKKTEDLEKKEKEYLDIIKSLDKEVEEYNKEIDNIKGLTNIEKQVKKTAEQYERLNKLLDEGKISLNDYSRYMTLFGDSSEKLIEHYRKETEKNNTTVIESYLGLNKTKKIKDEYEAAVKAILENYKADSVEGLSGEGKSIYDRVTKEYNDRITKFWDSIKNTENDAISKEAQDRLKERLEEYDNVSNRLERITKNAKDAITKAHSKDDNENLKYYNDLSNGVRGLIKENENLLPSQQKLADLQEWYNGKLRAYQETLSELSNQSIEQQNLLKTSPNLTEEEKENIKLKIQAIEDVKDSLNDEFTDITIKFTVDRTELEEAFKRERFEKLKANVTGFANGVSGILGTVADSWKGVVDAQVKAGEMSEEEAEKQYEMIKGLQSAQAVIQALVSANEAYASLASIPFVGPALGAAAAAAALAAGMANVYIINKTKMGDTGSSANSAMANMQVADSSPYSYVREVQTPEEYKATYEQSDTPIYVSVTDINNVQNKVKVRETETSF